LKDEGKEKSKKPLPGLKLAGTTVFEDSILGGD
jgi:hypothetical protein